MGVLLRPHRQRDGPEHDRQRTRGHPWVVAHR
jgi:hypothetical protein